MPEAESCVTCGEGIAVTTEGECGICDAISSKTQTPPGIFGPVVTPPVLSDGALVPTVLPGTSA